MCVQTAMFRYIRGLVAALRYAADYGFTTFDENNKNRVIVK